jgi:hypothetical protein
MVDKQENILVEFDYNNIIVIDPNKIIDENGNAKQRLVQHENLVMYANLECKVLPRTKLAVGVSPNDVIETISVASINFLKPGGKTFLDTSWTDEITGKGTVTGEGVNQPKQTSIKNPNRDNDFYIRQTTQSGGKPGSVDNGLLGITSINIRQTTAFMPTISMELVDVKGRALFESGDNSPYAAFFNLPYPLFYLTIKGYYGKAVRMGLMLQKFNARYQPDSGNFKIDLLFYTYKYTILSELSMAALIAAPHMYKTRISRQSSSGGPSTLVKVNETITERGYQKIKELYSEYKSKGLIPDDLPELTLVQLKETLDNFIKNKLDTFTKQNLEPISGCDDYQKALREYQGSIYYYTAGRISWFNKYMDKNNFYILNNSAQTKVYTFKKELNTPELRQAAITDLDAIIQEFNKKLNDNPTVGLKGSYKISGQEFFVKVSNPITPLIFNIDINSSNINVKQTYIERKGTSPTPQQEAELKKQITQSFEINSSSVTTKNGTKLPVTNFYVFEGPNTFIDLTEKMGRDLKVIREQIEQQLTTALTNLLENKSEGIGFIPNIRNILAVVFASGEAFLRMMDDVHTKAWELSDNKLRKQIILNNQTAGASQETFNNGDVSNTPIYPWPQYIEETTGENGHEKYELRYPGDSSVISKTKGYLLDVWPEIEFVEEFIKGFTERKSPPAEQNNNNEVTEVKRVSFNAIEFPIGNYVFSNKEEVKFFYEIYERMIYLANYSKLSRVEDAPSFVSPIIKIISECEKTNIKNGLSNGSPFIVDKLKNYTITSANFLQLLRQFSNGGTGESWQNYIRGIFNTKYIKNTINNASFEFLNADILNEKFTQPVITLSDENKIQEFISSSTNIKFDFTDTYPFTNKNWIKKYLAQSSTVDSAEMAFKTPEVLKYNSTNKIISNFLPTTNKTVARPFTTFAQENGNEPNLNPNQNNQVSSLQFIGFFRRKPEQQIVTEGVIRYSNYSGGTSFRQTTSILNTPYFVNSIQQGIKNFRNYDKNPYTAAAYLFINSLPLSTLKEKYTKYENDSTIFMDYIFATIKKFGAVHKVPYAWILKLGSVWHRYKKFVEENVDILDSSWKSFEYITNYDPITSATTKTYNLTINNSPVDIVLEDNNFVGTETSSLINVGFYPKLINDFNVFLNGYEIIQSNSQINGSCFVSGTTLTITQVNSATIQPGYTLAGINLLPNTTIISQIGGSPGGVGTYQITPAQTGTTALFSVTNATSVGYNSTNIQNALDFSGLSMYYASSAIINEVEGFDPNNPQRDLRIIPWSLSVDTNDKNFMYVLPSSGTLFNQTKNECFNNNNKLIQEVTGNTSVHNGAVRLFWTAPNYGYFDNSRIKKVKPDEYLKRVLTADTFQDAFTLTGFDEEYSKIDELFSVFEKEIMDGFEKEFLRFSKSVYDYEDDLTVNPSETITLSTSTNNQDNSSEIISFLDGLKKTAQQIGETILEKSARNFQQLMRNLLILPKITGNTGVEYVKEVQTAQFSNIITQLKTFLDFDVTFKFGNPSNYDRKLFTTFSNLPLTDPYEWSKYTVATPDALPRSNGSRTLTSSQNSFPQAWSTLKTYVGFSEIPELKYTNNGSYITDFFIDLNIAFTPENIQLFAPIIKIYATQKLNQFQSNYIPPQQTNTTQPTNSVVATAFLKSGGTVNVEKSGSKFRTTYYNSDNVLLFEGAFNLPPNNNVYTVSGSEIYYTTLVNQTITGLFGSTSTNPNDAQFITTFDRVTPSSYTPEPNSTNSNNSSTFYQATSDYLNKVDGFMNKIIDSTMIDVRNSLDAIQLNPEERDQSVLQGEPQPKLEMWEMFKALNDKWIAGGDFKTKTLFEDVLLLDRASRNIGDKVLVDIYKLKDRLQGLIEREVNKTTMLIFVQSILVENNFVVMNIPSYVNFYGVQDAVKNPKPKIEGTLDFANTMFGTYLNVDYRESSAKMVCFYGGKPSEQLDLKNNVDYRKRSDAFELRRASDNPLIENQIGKTDWDMSNKVVGFNVDIGPQNQGIFISFNVGQDAGKATSESLEATNMLANQGNNRAGSSQSVSLYNLYKNRSYSCDVDMMGNALIQPTMYFNLRNVPMFSGPYMILEVNHSIRPGMFSTRFTGIRQPTAALPKIDNFLQSLKQNLVKTIIEKNKQEKDAAQKKLSTNSVTTRTTTPTKLNAVGLDQNCTASTKYSTYVVGTAPSSYETLQNIVNQIASKTDSVLLRYCMFARIYFISGGETIIESFANNFAGITLNQDWGPSEAYFSKSKKFFCTPQKNPMVFFDTLNDQLNFMFERWRGYPTSLKLQNNTADITKFVVITLSANFNEGENNYKAYVGTEELKNFESIVQKSIDLYNSVTR